MLLGYSLRQQPHAEHLSILWRECHGPDVAHRLLDGTWLRSASRISISITHQHPILPPCDVLVQLWQCAASSLVFIYRGGDFETCAYDLIKKTNRPWCLLTRAVLYSGNYLPWTRSSPSPSPGSWGCAHERASASVAGGSRPPRLRVRSLVRPRAAWRQPRPPPRSRRGGGSQRPDSPAPPSRSAAAWCDRKTLPAEPPDDVRQVLDAKMSFRGCRLTHCARIVFWFWGLRGSRLVPSYFTPPLL